MDRETTREIWGLLEANLQKLEVSLKPEPHLLGQTQVAVGMLLDCDLAEVVRCVQESSLPTRALVSWLAYEGSRLGMTERVSALERQWAEMEQGQGSLIGISGPMGRRPAALENGTAN